MPSWRIRLRQAPELCRKARSALLQAHYRRSRRRIAAAANARVATARLCNADRVPGDYVMYVAAWAMLLQ